MSILSINKLRRLSLGFSIVDNAFPGFELGDFAALRGNAASFMSFLLSVRSQLPLERGGLESSTTFVDGGNLFSPYSIAEIARECGLDPKEALDRVYVSRAFTVYQLSSLILEKLHNILKKTKSRLLIVSDITALFLDRDVPKTEAIELFIKVRSRLAQIASEEQAIVAVSYFPERRSRQNLFLEAALFGKCNISIRLERRGRIFTFILEDHPHIKPFNMDFTADQAPSTMCTESASFGENRSIL
jgi:hypothetical protein